MRRESRSGVRVIGPRPVRGAAVADAQKTVTARLSLSASALTRLLSVSGSASEWILSSVDGSTTVRVRLAIASVPDAAMSIGSRGVELDFARNLLSHRARQVTLTRMELRLLGALLEHAPDTVPRAELIARLWSSARVCKETEGALAVWICALRRRFAALGVQDAIRTARNTGYSLAV
jgi:DNA-binding response OmpR family regulator